MADKLYTEDSIESLNPLEFTRLRPQVYAGDCTYSTQLLVEIISNAVDEFRLGHGKTIKVILRDDVVTVEDNGQGFLVNSIREDGKTVLEAAFSVLNTSGKYREDGTYEGTSLGSFGIGSKICTFLSNWLEVTTYRDNKIEHIYFKEGVFDKRESSDNFQHESGTIVKWKPSNEFFTNTQVEISKIKTLFKTISCLCQGLIIELDDNGERIVYESSNGLNDLVDEVKDKEIIKNRFVMNYAEGKEKIDMILTYTSNYSLNLIPYVNTGLTEKGPHITQIKTIITREFNKFFKEKKWLKENDKNLSGEDIQEGMYIIFNIIAPNVGYDAQVKSTITKIEMSNFNQALSESLQMWLELNEKEVKIIADKALAARKANEAAKKARDLARNKIEKKQKVLKMPSKLSDCYSKDRTKCELYIVEGDSAAGNMKEARDNETQAILPVRGKIINCRKTDWDKAMANAEIRDMINAFGGDIDVKNKKINLDLGRVRYSKIIVASDADIDGAHIATLFYTFVWEYMPQLIENGYIYSAVPPLYRITMNNKYIYIQDDADLSRFKKEHGGKKYLVNRLKGYELVWPLAIFPLIGGVTL